MGHMYTRGICGAVYEGELWGICTRGGSVGHIHSAYNTGMINVSVA